MGLPLLAPPTAGRVLAAAVIPAIVAFPCSFAVNKLSVVVVAYRPFSGTDLDAIIGCADEDDAINGAMVTAFFVVVVIVAVAVAVAGMTSGGNKSIQRNPSAVEVSFVEEGCVEEGCRPFVAPRD